jgi:hypothetical protein
MENKTKEAAPAPQMLGGFDLFKPSINIIKLNFKTFVTLLAVPILTLLPIYLFNNPSKGSDMGGNGSLILALSFIGYLALALVNPAIVYTQLKGARKEVVQPGEAFQTGLKYFWRILGAEILCGLIFVVSFVALVVPFFFMYRRYILVTYYIVDRDMRVMEALKKSAEDSVTYKSPMWGLVGVSFLTQLPSFIRIIGWIPGLLYSGAAAYRYTEVTDASSGKHSVKQHEQTPHESLKEVL